MKRSIGTSWIAKAALRSARCSRRHRVGALHTRLEALGYPGLDGFCPDCARLYCYRHFTAEEVWSGSWYDTAYGTCPHGHRRELG